MSKIKTDSDVVRVARQIDAHLQIVRELTLDLEESEHPYAAEIKYALDDNEVFVCAWATHVVAGHLLHPERWETDSRGIHYKGKGES